MAFLDSLVAEMEDSRIGLHDIDISKAKPTVQGINEIKGAIAEHLVREWIDRCPDLEHFTGWPRNVNGYSVRELPSGIVVFEGDQTKVEYDSVVSHQGNIALIEVKSLRLNGVEGKIENALKIGRKIFPEAKGVGMLICFPHYSNKAADARIIEASHTNVRCVDLGYKKKQLMSALQTYCQKKGLRI